MADEPNKMRAEIRARQAEDGKKAMAEYEASAAATRAKTEKLKALRLSEGGGRGGRAQAAREDQSQGQGQPGAKSVAKKKKAAPEGKLSDWLEDQGNSGRRT